MGVDLGSLLPCEAVTMKDLDGKVLFVDGNNVLYQFLATIRQRDGTPLKDRQDRVTSHLAGLIYRTANLVEAGILPVFVWDGQPDERKTATLDARRKRRETAAKQAEQARAEGDLELARTKAAQSARLTREMIGQADDLLGRLGVPTVQAPSEGEAQAARAVQEGIAYASISQDYDSLLFATPRLVRNLTVTQRRKVPGQDRYVDVEPELIELAAVLGALDLSHEQLVAAGVLIGTDYHPGVKGVGPKKALAAIREHGDLAAAAAALELDDAEVEGLEVVASIFLDPVTAPVEDPSWGPVDRDGVRDLLVREYGFSQDRVDNALDRYANLERSTRQVGLGDFV